MFVLSARALGVEPEDGTPPEPPPADGGQPEALPGDEEPSRPAEPVVASEPAPSPVTEPSEQPPATTNAADAAPSEPMPASEPEPARTAVDPAPATPEEPVAPPAEQPAPAIAKPALPPPPPMNEFAFELGWNAPAGAGMRYMRQIEDTKFAIGAGFAPLTFWGVKLSFLARWAPSLWEGRYVQASLGLSTGADEAEQTLTDTSGATTTALFRKTPGRTLDLVVGYRFGRTSTFLDIFGGYSLRLKGAALQLGTPDTLRTVDQAARDALDFQSPGGIVWGASYGWRF